MTTLRFWVIGGEYASMEFDALKTRPQVEGPFGTRDEARAVWKRLSAEYTSRAAVRFSIASERMDGPTPQ